MALDGLSLDGYLHATTDSQAVRDRVFSLISGNAIRIDATILEKSKAEPQLRISDDRFYKYAWYYHFKNVAPKIVKPADELLICAASLGTKKKCSVFRDAINDVVRQSISPTTNWKTAFWPASSDPCLQIADYCAWAIQRKWEGGDTRSYDLIKGKIIREYDLFARGTTHYY